MEMQLKDLVLASELARYAGYHVSRYAKGYFVGKTINIDGNNYIPKIYITGEKDKEALKKCTNLDNYMTIAYASKFLFDLSPNYLRYRIKFQNETGKRIFDYKKLNGVYYIEIPLELQQKLKKGVSFAITDMKRFNDFKDVRDIYIFGDVLIVFM